MSSVSSITDAHGVQLVDSLKRWCGIDEPQVIEVRILFVVKSALVTR